MATFSAIKHNTANAIPATNGRMREILLAPGRNMSTMYHPIWAVQTFLPVLAADYPVIDCVERRTLQKIFKKIFFGLTS